MSGSSNVGMHIDHCVNEDPQKLAAIRDALRPVMVSLRDCRRVLLEGVTFQNSPAWNIHPLFCEHLTVRGATVKNPWYAQNGDGLDLHWAFTVVFLVYVLIAGLLAFIGLRQVKKVKAPERAIEQGRQIPQALKGRP